MTTQKNTDNSQFFGHSEAIIDLFVTTTLKNSTDGKITRESLEKAARELKIDQQSIDKIFKNGESDIIAYWQNMLDKLNTQLAESHDLKNNSDIKIRDKISMLTKQRVREILTQKEFIKPYIWNEKSCDFMHSSLSKLWDSADLIWGLIGDKTEKSDLNYYSKRTILSSIIFIAVCHGLRSDKDDIDEFIDDKINKVLKLGKVKELLKHLPFRNHPLKMR